MEQKKYPKTYELKQVIKAYAEYLKNQRLSYYGDSDEYDESYKKSKEKLIELLNQYNLIITSFSGNKIIKYKIRFFYIAYGLLRKKPYNVIETPREQNALNEYDWKDINELMEIFKEKEVQNV